MTQNKSFQVFSWILSLAVVAGCAEFKTNRKPDEGIGAPPPEDSPAVVAQSSNSPPQKFPIVDPSRFSMNDTSKTGVIFAWSLTGSSRLISDSGCRLRVRNRESGDTVLLKIDPRTPVTIQSLKPGTWDAKRLGCGMTRIWDLDGLFQDGFVVKAGSISVIGWFVFAFDDRTLVTVREGGRQENSNLAMQLRSAWSGSSGLISGFSGKPLPMKIDARDEIVRVKSTGLKDSDQVLQPLLLRFQNCASEGMKVDPLRAGTLKMEATYKAGKFTGAKTVAVENALRDDLVQCILRAHETFTVPNGGDFTLDTTY